MVNQQLLDYIKQQLQLGVAKDAVKSTLLSSGWPEADVVEALGAASPAAAQATPAQHVGDIIQPKSDPAKAEPVAVKKAESFQTKIDTYQTAQVTRPGASVAAAAPATGKSGRSLILPIVEGVIILLLIGGLWYLYGLNSELQTDTATKSASNGDLTKQLTTLSQENSKLLTERNAEVEKNADLSLNLSFVLAETGVTSTITNNVKGTLHGDDKTPYTFITTRGLILNVKNYKDPRVNPLLKPLLNTTTILGLSYVSGSREVTVTSVNGVAIPDAPPATTTSTVTSTMPAAPKP